MGSEVGNLQIYQERKATSTAELQNKIQSEYSLKYRLKTHKDYKLYQKTPGIMANCNPVVPVMDWTEDAELHKRYVEWKEEVELELGSSLSNRSNSEV